MKLPLRKAVVLSAVMLATVVNSAICANIYNSNVIGYVNVTFASGSNLICNPLDNDSGNLLSDLFPTTPYVPFPAGTSVSLWNPTNLSFYLASVFTNGSWSTNFSLPPGTGALLVIPVSFVNTFNGIVLGHDGGMTPDLDNPFPPPPVYGGPNGLFLLGDKAPLPNVGTNIFLNILGRPPFPGEQVITLSGTNTYLGGGTWDAVPTLNVGSSALLNIMAPPAPMLSIQYVNNDVVVSWPSAYTNWILQTNGDLANGSWSNYTDLIVNTSVTNPASGNQLYYRLVY